MYTSQPQGAVSVDWGNPLTRDLETLHNCSNQIDAVNGKALVVVGSVSQDILALKGSRANNAGANIRLLSPNMPKGGTVAQTIFCLVKLRGVSYSTFYCCGAQAVARGLGLHTTGTRFGIGYGEGAVTFTNTFPAGYYLVVATVSPTGTIIGYCNGVLLGSAQGQQVDRGGDRFASLNLGDTYALSCPETVFLAGKFNRCLSANEVSNLSINPWQLFKQPARRLFIPASLPWFLISQPYTKQLDSLPHGVLLYNSLFIPTHERIVTSLPKYILPYHDLLVPTHNSVAVSLPKHIESVIELVGGTFTALHDYLVQYIYQETFYHPSVERTFYVKPEQRVYNVSVENRVFTLQPESRVYNVPTEQRIFKV